VKLSFHLSYFKQAYAHYLLSGMLNCFVFLDNGDSTNIGLTDKTSNLGYYNAIPSDKKVLKTFVVEYKVTNGIGF